jgi:hypothetical protein
MITLLSVCAPAHVCVCQCMTPIVARQRLEKKLVARQRHGSVKNLPIVASQRLGRDNTAVTYARATIEELLDASFSMRSVSYQGK